MAERKRVLITGISGFTGRYMAKEMAEAGYMVYGVGSMSLSAPNYHRANLCAYDEVATVIREVRPAIVIHLAGVAFVAYGDSKAFYEVNLLGTRNLLQALADEKITPEKVLLASSANVYGNTSSEKISESCPPIPINDYAVSKLAMEHMARLWFDRIPIVITRPFNYSGRGQNERFLLPKIVAHYKSTIDSIKLGNLDVRRDFSDVRALVSAYRRLIETESSGCTVNVCSGVTYSVAEILDICTRLTGKQLSVTVADAYVRPNELKVLCGDADMLERLIGRWETPPLESTLSWMLGKTE